MEKQRLYGPAVSINKHFRFTRAKRSFRSATQRARWTEGGERGDPSFLKRPSSKLSARVAKRVSINF